MQSVGEEEAEYDFPSILSGPSILSLAFRTGPLCWFRAMGTWLEVGGMGRRLLELRVLLLSRLGLLLANVAISRDHDGMRDTLSLSVL